MNEEIINITTDMVEGFNGVLQDMKTNVRLSMRKHKDVMQMVDITTIDIYQLDNPMVLSDDFYMMLESFFNESCNIKLNYNNTRSCFWARQN